MGVRIIHSADEISPRALVSKGLPDLFQRLWRFCMVLTKTRDAADDLAQAACERALLNADKFEVGTDLDRWVFTIARRIWLNDIRSAKVRRGEGLVPVEEVDISDNAPHIARRPTRDHLFGLC